MLIELCTGWRDCEREALPEADWKAAFTAHNELLAKKGLRVLAGASRSLSVKEFDPAGDLFVYMEGLCFEGLVGLMDPPRPEVRDAIGLCHEAGIAVKMITGDQKVTAAAIAAELGISGDV